MKKIIAILLLVALLTLTGCARENNTVRVCEVTRSIFYAPQYVALALGYFKDEGLSVELTTGEGADAVMAGVLSGSIDIGFAGPEASIYVYNEGKDNYCQVFAQMTQRDGSFLVSRTDEKDFKWSDLKGSHILPGRVGGVPYMTFEYVLKNAGLDTKKDLLLDNSVQFSMMGSAFASGTGDYVTLFEPSASALVREGKGYIVASVGESAGDIPYTAYFASLKYIDKNADVIEKFTRAVYRGLSWVHEHTSREIAEVVHDYFAATDLDTLTAAVESYKSIDAWCKTPVLSKESFDRLQDVIESAGELTRRADYSKVVNNTFAEKVIK